ncbi:hypothetical protein GWI33_007975 [Rhynchophorus ferrugineus]|uniref:Uncharacterized protein n=1 Tax=Rhynchophorus ferrugineus TaxID=354439 RepID=A0A834IDF5_RHYFE|nr:hypothetical protein GWI33_007975 [Rhynchophorus ferrugineus]
MKCPIPLASLAYLNRREPGSDSRRYHQIVYLSISLCLESSYMSNSRTITALFYLPIDHQVYCVLFLSYTLVLVPPVEQASSGAEAVHRHNQLGSSSAADASPRRSGRPRAPISPCGIDCFWRAVAVLRHFANGGGTIGALGARFCYADSDGAPATIRDGPVRTSPPHSSRPAAGEGLMNFNERLFVGQKVEVSRRKTDALAPVNILIISGRYCCIGLTGRVLICMKVEILASCANLSGRVRERAEVGRGGVRTSSSERTRR